MGNKIFRRSRKILLPFFISAFISRTMTRNRHGREKNEGGLHHMCGIVGFVGEEQAAPILLSGLEKLEYRGYGGDCRPQ